MADAEHKWPKLKTIAGAEKKLAKAKNQMAEKRKVFVIEMAEAENGMPEAENNDPS